MKRFHALMMLTALLAITPAIHAQGPEPRTTQVEAFPYPLVDVRSTASDCPLMNQSWFGQGCQYTVAAWQRLRAVCMSGQQEACCEKTGRREADVVAGGVLLPKACACVKACACCEMCKAQKEGSARVQMMPTPQMLKMLAGMHGIPMAPPCAMPELPACVPPVCGTGVVQVMPVPAARVVQVVQVAHHVKPVHLVTPDLDAVCERMTHRGDTVVLEGNVLLLCKKHAQPIRIEAQRVVVNMKDGSFTVESTAAPMTTTGISVQPVAPADYRVSTGVGMRIVVPMMGPVPMCNDFNVPVPPPPSDRTRFIPRGNVFRHDLRMPEADTTAPSLPNIDAMIRSWLEMYR